MTARDLEREDAGWRTGAGVRRRATREDGRPTDAEGPGDQLQRQPTPQARSALERGVRPHRYAGLYSNRGSRLSEDLKEAGKSHNTRLREA